MDTVLQNIINIVGTMVTIKRLSILMLMFIVYTFINMIIKYIITIFVIFCVVYTLQDVYKHRKKIIPFLKIIINSIILFTKFAIGDEYAQYIQTCCMPSKIKKPRNKK